MLDISHIHLNDPDEDSRRSLRQTLRYLFHVVLPMLADFNISREHQTFVGPLDGIYYQLNYSHAFFESHVAYLLTNYHHFVLQVYFAEYFVFVCLHNSLLFHHLAIVKFFVVLNALLIHKVQYVGC